MTKKPGPTPQYQKVHVNIPFAEAAIMEQLAATSPVTKLTRRGQLSAVYREAVRQYLLAQGFELNPIDNAPGIVYK